MWTVVRPGDILYVGNPHAGVALEEIKIDTWDDVDFQIWKSEMKRRKTEIQKKYSPRNNADYESRLRSLEEWMDGE